MQLHRCGCVAFFVLAMLASSTSAQTVLEMGMVNHGPLATEITHRVRTSSMPGSMTIGFGRDTRFRTNWHLAMGVNATVTTLTKTKCVPFPCVSTSRDYRPARQDSIVSEHTAYIVTPRLGVRANVPGPVDVEGGITFPIMHSNYSLIGADLMGVLAGYMALQLRGWVGAFGTRFTIVPAQPARWVAFSEHTGYKVNGRSFLNGENDPRRLFFVEAFLRLYVAN
ncbi:MAG: hypothetical protein ACREMA_02385 [Longimicrobiales bacterium]